jgi:hypothetical protein
VLFVALTILLVLGLCVGGAEIAARAYGRQPRQSVSRPEPVMHAPDAVLGWKTEPGTYVLGPYTADGDTITMTIRPDGARSNGTPPASDRPALLLVGCSFTIGWAVADDATWGARVQHRRPDLDVINRGVAGYGTYQSLLLLEKMLADQTQRPTWVLYGDIGHDLRNVGSLTWLSMLAGTRSTVATPYCTLRPNGVLVRHPPQSYPSLPLHERLASVALIENVWARWRVRDRATTSPRQLTDRLLIEMAALAERSGVRFSIVILTLDEHVTRARLAFARQNHIDVIDCNQRLSPTLTVPGEGHPNALAHQRWGDCVAAALAQPQRLPPGAGATHAPPGIAYRAPPDQ